MAAPPAGDATAARAIYARLGTLGSLDHPRDFADFDTFMQHCIGVLESSGRAAEADAHRQRIQGEAAAAGEGAPLGVGVTRLE